MTSSLIRFDDKHISAAQAIMADDRVLDRFIHNLSKSLNTKICGYLQDAEFLHVSRMLKGCKLDPTLTSVQLGLPVDGPIVTGPTIVSDKEDICDAFLGRCRTNFKIRSQSVVPAPYAVMGVVATTIYTSPNERSLYVSIGEKKEPWAKLRGTARAARRYSAIFEWMPYTDPNIIECIPPEFLAILKYVGCESAIDSVCNDGDAQIRSSDVAVQLDLWGKIDENWQDYHNEFIDILDRRMKFLPICEPFFLSNRATYLEYMHWFKVVGKSGGGTATSLSPTLTQQAPPMSTPHPGQFILLIPIHFTNPMVHFSGHLRPQHSTPHVDIDVDVYTDNDVVIDASINVKKDRTHSSMEECDGDEVKANGGDEDEDDSEDKDEYEDQGEDEKDEDNDHDEKHEPTSPLVHKSYT
ncbi:hypothetical protein Gotri_001287 [Gossypium trilobum]|uniref:Uncharacterized protein n=1 Tax=Gossypium trilobum TaxID=34281 RepID=A0A7J9FE62_9ROSI|nr:hypothetical protein [Gossypium trilobum]